MNSMGNITGLKWTLTVYLYQNALPYPNTFKICHCGTFFVVRILCTHGAKQKCPTMAHYFECFYWLILLKFWLILCRVPSFFSLLYFFTTHIHYIVQHYIKRRCSIKWQNQIHTEKPKKRGTLNCYLHLLMFVSKVTGKNVCQQRRMSSPSCSRTSLNWSICPCCTSIPWKIWQKTFQLNCLQLGKEWPNKTSCATCLNPLFQQLQNLKPNNLSNLQVTALMLLSRTKFGNSSTLSTCAIPFVFPLQMLGNLWNYWLIQQQKSIDGTK